MAKRPSVTTISSGFASNTQLNTNFTAIRDAFDNTLSLDGSTPNAMQADLDLNGNQLLNVGNIDADNLTLNGQTITDISSVPEWRSTWVTSRSYAKNDLVKEAGDVYICLISHTSGTFATDLTMLRWELFVQRGAAGAGTGDMLRANNLSDLTSASTARANLGLGTVATQNTVPVSMGGTGATDATAARTNLGLGSLATASSITTTEIAAATLVTASETIASNSNDTTIPTSAAVDAHIPAKLNATGSAPLYACRAWVNFNGTGTVAIRASGNVSSITDNGVGDYTINFTTAMPDANYACLVSQSRDGGTNPPTPVSTQNITSTSTKTSSAVRVGTGGNTGAYDATEISVAIFR
jgi:hypothetical protein